MTDRTQDIIIPVEEALNIARPAKKVSPRTRARWEAQRRFPRKQHITSKTYGYSKQDIEEWSRDPEAWIERHSQDPDQAA